MAEPRIYTNELRLRQNPRPCNVMNKYLCLCLHILRRLRWNHGDRVGLSPPDLMLAITVVDVEIFVLERLTMQVLWHLAVFVNPVASRYW